MQKTRPRGVKKYVKDLRMCRFFTKEGCLLHLFMNNMLSNVVLNELTRNNTKETKTSRRYICIQMHKHLPTFTNMNRTPAMCKMPHSSGLYS